MRVVEIVTECEHGEWVGPHCTMEREGRCPYAPTDTDRECYCPGGSRRVLEPGSFVLVEKVDGRWPMTNRVFDAIEDALVRATGSASMRTIETVVETYLDALAGGEQP